MRQAKQLVDAGEQLLQMQPESVGNLPNCDQRWVAEPTLNLAYVGSVQIGSLRQPFLRPASLEPKVAQTLSEALPEINVAWHGVTMP